MIIDYMQLVYLFIAPWKRIVAGWMCLVSVLAANAQSDSSTLNNPFKLLNTQYDEQSPAISPDGNSLFITIANHEQNMGGKADPGDIWISTKTASGWSAPVHGGVILNSKVYNAVLGFSPDGRQVFLANHYTVNGELPKTQGFAYSYKTATGWTAPQNIYIPYFLNRSQLFSGTIREDVFIFSAESYSSYGAEDLYITFKNGNSWSEPLNLGRELNSRFQELSPWLSEDKRTLYYASNNPKSSLGSFDIYSTSRIDGGWTSWSAPVNLGSMVNSEGRELFYRKLPNGLSFFTSTHNSDGYGDIKTSQDAVLNDSSFVASPTIATTIPDSIVRINGKTLNAKNNGVIAGAKISFRSNGKEFTAISAGTGDYLIDLPTFRNYSIEIEAANFINALERLELNTADSRFVELNFKLSPIEVGTTVNLKSVLFEVGSTKLLEESYDELNVVVDFLRSNPRVEIELEGHTDFRGDARKNLVLSQKRVDQVKNYLVSKGISGKRIRGKGYGGQRPIANSDTEEARKLNRRVEFMITKN